MKVFKITLKAYQSWISFYENNVCFCLYMTNIFHFRHYGFSFDVCSCPE